MKCVSLFINRFADKSNDFLNKNDEQLFKKSKAGY